MQLYLYVYETLSLMCVLVQISDWNYAQRNQSDYITVLFGVGEESLSLYKLGLEKFEHIAALSRKSCGRPCVGTIESAAQLH